MPLKGPAGHKNTARCGSNSIIILEDKILFKKASNFSKPIARLKEGRLLVIKKCLNDWCNVATGNYSGWVKNQNIWGFIK